ncbi:MAG: L,D-transpeptidase family protein [Hyphomicrobium sp.]
MLQKITTAARSAAIPSLIMVLAVHGTIGTTVRAEVLPSNISAEQLLPSQASVAAALQARLPAPDLPASPAPLGSEALAAFYATRNFSPLWVDARGPTRNAERLMDALMSAADWGLDAQAFALTANMAPRTNGIWTADQVAAAELELASLALRYANHARGGRIAEPEQMLSTYLDRRPQLPDATSVLVAITTTDRPDEALRAFHPQHGQFKKLQAAYANLRSAGRVDPAALVPRTGDLLLPGTRHDDVIALRKRLSIAATSGNDDLYDSGVVTAVKLFQERAGLNDDGYVGPATRKALSAGNETRLAAMRANLEQWRWMPAELGETHLLVNIPKFTIAVMENGEQVVEERVITGKSDTQTPVFSKSLSTIVLRPSWKLPDSIKLEKLLSAQRRGTSIESQGYVIKKGKRTIDSSSVDWGKAQLSHYEIFQPSGDGNALGDVKFLFPNKHSVYLHDTPMKALFNASDRLFSHGCIRLRNPLAMAQMLLDADKGESAVDVKYLVRRGRGSNEIQLDRPIPIHVGYFTTWAEDDGTISTYADVYGHEERIRLALDNKWKEIDKGDDHLAAVDTWELKSIRIVQRPASKRVVGFRRYDAPMGLTKAKASPSFFKVFGKSSGSSSDRNSVGEMMRNALTGR